MTPTDPFLRPLNHFLGARATARPEERLRAVRRASERLREELLSAPAVRYFRSAGLRRVPYPTRYGLRDACSVPTPYIHIVNRLFVVQAPMGGETRTILYSPSDIHANGETPFFKRLLGSMGPLAKLGEPILSPVLATVEERLAEIGIAPEKVDYISYDHLHTQDLRKWLGAGGDRGYFPNAKLLVMRQEWESTHGLLPTQAQWYCPHGTDGIDPARVVLLDGDVMLGESIALLHTPGHTEGNHSFVTRTTDGIFVTSENGIGPDAYAPSASRIPGLAKYARATGAEIVLNGNTLEDSVDQYISMVAEKTIAGPSLQNPEFPNVACSSELAGYWAFPGIHPTFGFGDITLGEPDLSPRRDGASRGAEASVR